MSTQNQQIVPLKDKANTVRALLEKSKQQFAMALPHHIKAHQFLRVAMTTIQKNPDLLKCTQTSLLGCLMESAQLGLQVDGLLGEAYLVPFNNKQKDGTYLKECQLIVGYRGFLKLGRNSGELSTVRAEVVFNKDTLEVKDGLEPVLKHIRSEEPPVTGKEPIESAVRGAYAIARMKDGSSIFVYLWKWEIDLARARSKASESGPWVTDYPEMAKKTALRRLAKYMPQSPEIQRAATLEDRADAGISQELGDAIDISATEPEPKQIENGSKLDALVDAEKGKRAASKPNGGEKVPEKPQAVKEEKSRQSSGKKEDRVAAAQTQGNPAYSDSEPDPFKTGELSFEREPGEEG